jgi:hypothetical protein
MVSAKWNEAHFEKKNQSREILLKGAAHALFYKAVHHDL